MPLVQWSNSVSVKNDEIDKQHKKLFDLLNNLHDAMTEGKGRQVVGNTLQGLFDYTRTHFIYEEDLLKKMSSPKYASHKAEHDQFVLKVMKLNREYQEGNGTITIEVTAFVKEWLVKHIQGVDQESFVQ
jgi:hemerythrin